MARVNSFSGAVLTGILITTLTGKRLAGQIALKEIDVLTMQFFDTIS